MSAERAAALATHALTPGPPLDDAPTALPPIERALWCLRKSAELAHGRYYFRAAYWCARANDHFRTCAQAGAPIGPLADRVENVQP